MGVNKMVMRSRKDICLVFGNKGIGKRRKIVKEQKISKVQGI